MNIYETLAKIQMELKAPKGQFNNFGKYNYRSCEDIIEAVKPLANKYKSLIILSDELVNIGDRYYIKATATLSGIEEEKNISVSAYAREEESKKGMDGSQITGTASSYARKYALNGLFAIDDTKDSDATNKGEEAKAPAKATPKVVPTKAPDKVAPKEVLSLKSIMEKTMEIYGEEVGKDIIKNYLNKNNYEKTSLVPIEKYQEFYNFILDARAK